MQRTPEDHSDAVTVAYVSPPFRPRREVPH